MIRYYFTPIAYSSTQQPDGSTVEENVVVAREILAANNLPHRCKVWIPPTDLGGRINGWCIAQVDGPDATHTVLAADNRLIALPTNLDSTFGQLTSAQRNGFNNRVTGAGYVVGWTNTTTLRQILTNLCGQIQPGFDFAGFHISASRWP